MANLYPPTVKYKIYIINRMIDQHPHAEQLTGYTPYDTRFDFDTEKQAEGWISQLGEKGQDYTILKTYHMH